MEKENLKTVAESKKNFNIKRTKNKWIRKGNEIEVIDFSKLYEK